MDAKAHGTPVEPKGQTVLHTFDYRGVRLLPSMFLDQVEQARRLYGGLANDDVLKGFREQAGQPAPGAGMKGWCKTTSAVIFGQLLSGLVRLGRATGDETLIAKAVALYEGWSATLAADGNARMRLYDFEKLVCGLVDLAQYGGIDAAFATLRKIVIWASGTFDRSRKPADGHDFWGAGPGDTSGTRCQKICTGPIASPAIACSGTLQMSGSMRTTGGRSHRRPRPRVSFPSTPIATSTRSRAPRPPTFSEAIPATWISPSTVTTSSWRRSATRRGATAPTSG